MSNNLWNCEFLIVNFCGTFVSLEWSTYVHFWLGFLLVSTINDKTAKTSPLSIHKKKGNMFYKIWRQTYVVVNKCFKYEIYK